MDDLMPHLASLVRDTLKHPDWYDWRMPMAPPVAVALPSGSLLDQTRALKFALSDAFNREQSRRVELATYFVRNWGGVRGNRASTMERYVLGEPDAVIRKEGFKGISSWSKVLHLRDPCRFFIYDARIAVVLNLVQLYNGLPAPLVFPIPDSQNRLIRAARRRLKSIAVQESWRRPSSRMYEDYNELLRRVGTAVEVDSDIVEMALFSRALGLTASWLGEAVADGGVRITG